jgi:cell wall-associated NlpC family hydrolase
MFSVADLIGKEFENNGRGPDKYDCWGLTLEVFGRFGIRLPDYRIHCHDSQLIDQTYRSQKIYWEEIKFPEVPPVLIVFRFNQAVFCNHVGTFIGAGRFIHTRENIGACIESLDHPYWRKVIEGFLRYRGEING